MRNTAVSRIVPTLLMVAALAACGGGESDEPVRPGGTGGTPVATLTTGFGSASPQSAGQLPSGPAGCSVPAGEASGNYRGVGNYKVYAGDCVVSLSIPASRWEALLSGMAQSTTTEAAAVARDFSLVFKDSFDFLVVMLDTGGSAPPAAFNYQGAYNTLGTRTPRSRTLMGVMVFPHLVGSDGRSVIEAGPFLHELAHEWANRGIIPSATDPGHWGFSSAAGQLGGWGDLSQLSAGVYQGTPPTLCYSAEATEAARAAHRFDCSVVLGRPLEGFGTFANGGNTPRYSKLERFVMGLLPAGKLGVTTVAQNAQWVNASRGIFTASGFSGVPEATVISNLGDRYVPYERSQKNFRMATLVLTRDEVLASAKVNVLNAALTNMTMDEYPASYIVDYGVSTSPQVLTSGKVGVMNNFHTATERTARLRAMGIYAERR